MRTLARVLAALLLALAGLASCAQSHIEAGLLLADLAAAPGQPSVLARLAPAPERRQVSYGDHVGDLYTPGQGAAGALVLVPGAARTGKDDPRVVAFATALARARFQVLVPDLKGARALVPSAADADDVADAVRELSGGRRKVAVAAVSYAAVPAVLAALQPDLAEAVDPVVAIGPPYDLGAVVTFFTTGWYREQAGMPWQHAEPNAYGKWVFVAANAGRMEDSADRALLAAIARRRMEQPDAPIDDLVRGLTPQGRAVMALLDNRDPERAPALLAGLPASIRSRMAELDLSRRDLAGLKARVMVVHGRDDRIIPWTEGAALARAAPRGRLYLLDSLAHADLRPGGLADTATLWRAVVDLLDTRRG
ncbi:MAG: alpha/beta fold hydrolase [Actinomycetota bacterium]